MRTGARWLFAIWAGLLLTWGVVRVAQGEGTGWSFVLSGIGVGVGLIVLDGIQHRDRR